MSTFDQDFAGARQAVEQLAASVRDQLATGDRETVISALASAIVGTDPLGLVGTATTAVVMLAEQPPPEPRRSSPIAPNGCDDCSVEPGESHRYATCPGVLRTAERTGGQP